MEYRALGRTGVQVSRLCLGAMMFGAWGNRDADLSVRMILTALDRGVNFIDTADLYGHGESEEIVGRALAGGRRDDVVVATKFSFPMGDDPNRRGTSRRWIMQAAEASLRRLGTDWIDLYQMHRWDPAVEHEETLGALTDLVHQGKVRLIGSSTLPPEQIVESQWIARERRLQRYACEQPPYSLLARGVEAAVLPTCARYSMGVMVWSPLAAGWLSGKWRKDADGLRSRRLKWLPARFDLELPENQAKLAAADAFAILAGEIGISLIHLALAFVLNHPAVTAAIAGPRTMEQLESQLGATDVRLDDATLDRIDEIVMPGRTVNPVDDGWINPAIAPDVLRGRRSVFA